MTNRGYLTYEPAKCCIIVLTCCILHNICVRNNLPLDNEDSDGDDSSDDDVNVDDGNEANENAVQQNAGYAANGLQFRANLIDQCFQ
jgi:hypothetical protein